MWKSSGNTALFVRIERQTREELPSTIFHGYRQAFEEQYTKLLASAKGSTSHHRIVRYRFGGLDLLVRSGVDAYLRELVTGSDSAEETGAGDLLNHVNRVQTLSLGSRVTSPLETEKFNGSLPSFKADRRYPMRQFWS